MSLRTSARLGTTLLTAGLLAWGAPWATAQAAQLRVETHNIYEGSTLRGSVSWNPNPSGSIPGDALRVCDLSGDGWAIEAVLWRQGIVEREVSTRGHNADYCTPWVGGNLPENQIYGVKVFKVHGTSAVLLDEFYVNT
ncbi:hypothetical protein ACIBCM_20910 [Streptomyces sp. NPDC051018]|uniref:hypothetical protein n=1 Tax=Streptomyces sp. NPDC051018 TaxID=3365639 RepID=UPI0037AAE4A3